MALLQRSDWYDVARDTNWTPSFVGEEDLFPAEISDPFNMPKAAWAEYDEPYKVSYAEYVKVQREKDAGVYAVNTAAARTRFMEEAGQRWHSILKLHFGAVSLAESSSQISEGRMARFGRAPGMRNMATFGLLDEIRHGQAQLYFAHESLKHSPQFNWAHKLLGTQEWGAIMTRATLDDVFLGRDAVTTAIMLTFAFETGFTNMQFIGLAGDAAEAGDTSFSNLISSIQTDESRHAQIGAPLLKLMVKNGYKAEAQRAVDVGFWRTYRFFSLLTGTTIDYFTPLEKRTDSFKEFMDEWIIGQFERTVLDMGLDLPWYWDYFIQDVNEFHHGMHLGWWLYRDTVWFNVPAGVSPAERDWLEAKYPGWNDKWGRIWDQIGENIRAGKTDLTIPKTLPVVCSFNNLPICHDPSKPWDPAGQMLTYKGKKYYFQSHVEKWVFEQDPERYADHQTLIDQFLAGKIQPPNYEGALNFMGLSSVERGKDAENYAWAFAGRGPQKIAAE
ncbi:YHS domain-containing protein [Oleomonas cavernae]|uniref:YHS domain-containing protein n=1 Tax=Oleomonas cavernae TaxID=2320859 RepID=A0A418WFQ8_9PROT|nr:YHS domain-containing protein [Oleomonas cavernae]RJF88846.1 YHS domain-containing protein [Oleomonas cavernae]